MNPRPREEPRDYVLVVDDDADIRESMELALGLSGRDVVSVPDGDEALRWLRGGGAAPCVILLDLMMPGMNGFELMSRLVADPELATIPVVVITGGGRVVERRAERLHFDVLRKPVELTALLATINRFCSEAGRPRP